MSSRFLHQWHTRLSPRVPLICSYHIMMSSVIYLTIRLWACDNYEVIDSWWGRRSNRLSPHRNRERIIRILTENNSNNGFQLKRWVQNHAKWRFSLFSFLKKTWITTLPPIVPRSQVIVFSSIRESQNSVASCFELLNSAVITKSLSFSLFANYTRFSACLSCVVYRSAFCLQSAIPSSPFVLLVN